MQPHALKFQPDAGARRSRGAGPCLKSRMRKRGDSANAAATLAGWFPPEPTGRHSMRAVSRGLLTAGCLTVHTTATDRSPHANAGGGESLSPALLSRSGPTLLYVLVSVAALGRLASRGRCARWAPPPCCSASASASATAAAAAPVSRCGCVSRVEAAMPTTLASTLTELQAGQVCTRHGSFTQPSRPGRHPRRS